MKQLTKESSQEELRAYFALVLDYAKTQDEFPVDLDDVWPLAYTQKGHAVRDLKELGIFFEGEDYISGKDKEPIFTENRENLSEDETIFPKMEKINLKISLKKKWKHAVVRKKNIILPHLALNISSPARFDRYLKFIANVYTQRLVAMLIFYGRP